MKYPEDWHFPVKCPVCGAGEGTPDRVSIEAALMTVEVRCAKCAEVWTLSAPAPAMFLESPALAKAPLG